MPATRRGPAALVTVLAPFLAITCGGDGSTTPSTPSTPSAPTAAAVAGVALTPALASVNIGATVQFAATLTDARGQTLTGRTVSWSTSDAATATVSANGLVSGVKLGSASITASSEGISGSAAISVLTNVATIVVAPSPDTLVIGRTRQLSAIPRDAAGAALSGKSVAWSSSDTTKARVSATGLVTAVATGSASITATIEGKTGASVVVVPVSLVASIALTAPANAVTGGASLQLSAAARNAAGAALTGSVIEWSSSDTSTATVTATGLLTALGSGPATITASSEGKSASATITVTAPTLTLDSQIGRGYLSATVGGAVSPGAYAFGVSYYVAISQLTPQHAAGTQLGWGTWIKPDNAEFTSPLCPVGTIGRDQFNLPPSWTDVFQTIEGGPGVWVSTKFPSTIPKFRINSTPNCYNNEVASTGWNFGMTRLPDNWLGLAQVSNRLLTVPDGLPLLGDATQQVLGYAWLALPLVPAYRDAAGSPVGDQSWTLFLNASNFSGPVAFFTPGGWATLSNGYHAVDGRGLDTRPARAGAVAVEFGRLPVFTSIDWRSNVAYRRIPKLQFNSASGVTTLAQDVRFYSKAALWDGVATWLAGGAPVTSINAGGTMAPAISSPISGLNLGSESADLRPFLSTETFALGSGTGFGLRWAAGAAAGGFPEYFRKQGTAWIAVPASQVPRTTYLQDQAFAPLPRSAAPDLIVTATSAWTSTRWAAGPFTTTLTDGSVVDYVWYRFVDQPAISRLNLDAATLARLQTFVESVHAQGITGVSIANPTAAQRVALDPALFVTPPAALSRGYVPIVIRQR